MDTKKKLVFILPNLEAGGAERVTLNYIRLLKLNSYDITLIIINDYGDLHDYIPDNINIINLKINRTRYAFFKLIKTINTIMPDVVFSSTDRTNLLVLISKIFIQNKPKIIIREPNMDTSQYGISKQDLIYTKLKRKYYQKADMVIAQTKAMKKEIINLYKIPPDIIKVVQNPLDKKNIKAQIQKNFNYFNQDYINVVASGRLHKQKGFDFLIDAFEKVIFENKKFRLWILGKKDVKDNCTEKLKKIIKNKGLNRYVNLVGFQSNPYPFYKHADLFVLSSRWEGLPNVVLENLFIGTPVVATNCVPILRELIHNGKNGKIVNFGDIEELTKAILDYKQYTEKVEFKSDYQKLNEIFK